MLVWFKRRNGVSFQRECEEPLRHSLELGEPEYDDDNSNKFFLFAPPKHTGPVESLSDEGFAERMRQRRGASPRVPEIPQMRYKTHLYHLFTEVRDDGRGNRTATYEYREVDIE